MMRQRTMQAWHQWDQMEVAQKEVKVKQKEKERVKEKEKEKVKERAREMVCIGLMTTPIHLKVKERMVERVVVRNEECVMRNLTPENALSRTAPLTTVRRQLSKPKKGDRQGKEEVRQAHHLP